ncbi:hypothetical protein GGI25_003963 [Coemansia spiralis]|uniref:Actin n=2 Tax=Coemansia TaxID=4863 RepID=A0A9W8G7G4_9FUNG|nr:actin-domain-containing protein [Coemansia spiralis]KAJ1990774.1 hypothetical protein EDC05_003869 [Coemansia umbellata]KAJ2620882.1 hypothetical protein GGI26_004580 [Coemansia sp. RSA 1358]KAJ2675456.1 hypothetical protein GGI25_003963 [Coemansia spiralis]
MVVSYREETFVVIELGSHTTKAIVDTTDINKLPTVVLATRAGILKQENAGASTPSVETKAAAGEHKETDESAITPSSPKPKDEQMDIDVSDTVKIASSSAEILPSKEAINMSALVDTQKDNSASSAKEGDQDGNEVSYAFGSALEAASNDMLESTIDIIVDGFVKDWDALSAFLRYLITKELGIRISSNISPIMFSVPPLWPKTDLESLTQIAFEHLNAPTIVISEQPLAAIYGNGEVTGLVVDFGHAMTTITPIVDSCIQSSAIVQTPVSGAAVTKYLHRILQGDITVSSQFESGQVPIEFADALKESGLCRLQISPGNMEEDNGGASAEPPIFEFDGKKYKLNRTILHQTPEILVNPTEPGAMRLTSLMQQAVLSCDPDKRAALWEHIHIVGGSSRFAGLKEYVQSELETTVLPTSNIFAISQTREIKFASLPEYFVGWRNHDHWAGFLGACIMAKIVMNDTKHNISKTEYNDSGPSIVHTKSS